MAKLKKENTDKCISILENFIEKSGITDKRNAIMALEQLKKINAGMDTTGEGICLIRPRAEGQPGLEASFIMCASRPRADGTDLTQTAPAACIGQPRADGNG